MRFCVTFVLSMGDCARLTEWLHGRGLPWSYKVLAFDEAEVVIEGDAIDVLQEIVDAFDIPRSLV